MHANLYDDIVRHATVISGFHTYPHVDIHAAGLRAANVIVRTLKGEIKPVMRWGNKPMLPHVMRQARTPNPTNRCRSAASRWRRKACWRRRCSSASRMPTSAKRA